MDEKHEDWSAAIRSHVGGNEGAGAQRLARVYDELRALAATYLANERPGQTLQPTALVHEAYLRLVDMDRINWQGRTHFFAVAARQMRRVLIDQARRALTEKRGGRPERVSLSEATAVTESLSVNLMALDEVLTRLSRRHPRKAEVAELRSYGGLNVDEVANALDISATTVKQDWRFARAWISRELQHNSHS